jgi:hypothetical protein
MNGKKKKKKLSYQFHGSKTWSTEKILASLNIMEKSLTKQTHLP